MPFELVPRPFRLTPLGPGAQGPGQKRQGNRQQHEGGSRQKQVFHHGLSTTSLEESYGRGQLPASRVKCEAAGSERPIDAGVPPPQEQSRNEPTLGGGVRAARARRVATGS